MFNYLESTIRDRLVRQKKLIRIDSNGCVVATPPEQNATDNVINILGPIPLPIELDQTEYHIDWFVSARQSWLTHCDKPGDELSILNGRGSAESPTSSIPVNSVLIVGDPKQWQKPLVRIHSSCLTGDVFGSKRCECGAQFNSALDQIVSDPDGGMLIYMPGHEGRGIGLWAKAAAYLLQDDGENTYQANRSLGLPDDSRDFGDAAALIQYFYGDLHLRLLTNNPKKIDDLVSLGLNHVERVKHVVGVNEKNHRYLSSKRDWGHDFDEDDLVLTRVAD